MTWVGRTAAPPPNDNLANPAAITPGLTGVAVTVSVDLTDATQESGERVWELVGAGGAPVYQSVWYTFVVPSNAASMRVRSGIAWG